MTGVININNLKEILKNNYNDALKIKKNGSVHFGDFKIPSLEYPLKFKENMQIFLNENTEKLVDLKVQEIYDKLGFKLGSPYLNVEMLKTAFQDNGITEFKTYSGWLFFLGKPPINHCWLLYKDKYLLDPTLPSFIVSLGRHAINKQFLGEDFKESEIRTHLITLEKSFQTKANSMYHNFGEVFQDTVYVGSNCTPKQGMNLQEELLAKIQNHPTYHKENINLLMNPYR